eukprot:463676-Rhodomonas_salina.1
MAHATACSPARQDAERRGRRRGRLREGESEEGRKRKREEERGRERTREDERGRERKRGQSVPTVAHLLPYLKIVSRLRKSDTKCRIMEHA